MSWAHPWGAGPANVIVRHLFGVRPTAPGWSEYVFDPRPGGIVRGQLTFTTPRGPIAASFELHEGKYRFAIKPDFGSNGDAIPASERGRVTVSATRLLSPRPVHRERVG